MKNKINNLTEDIQTFKVNDANLNIYFKKRFCSYNNIIIRKFNSFKYNIKSRTRNDFLFFV